MNAHTTAQVAKLLGVHKNTLLNWLRKGKLREPKRNGRGYRVWGSKDLRLAKAFVRKLRQPR